MFHRLESLRRQHTECRDGITRIENAAAAAGRDVTDAEQADIDTLFARAEQLDADIVPLAGKVEKMNATAAVLARIGTSSPAPLITRSVANATAEERASAGEFLSLFYRSQMGDTDAAELLQRAVATQTTADTAGVIPTPIIGDLINLVDDSRPVFGSMTSRPMPPKGATFTRPKITQRVNVGEQATQLDELASRKMIITGNPVTKRTFGGVLELSEQDIDWTDPVTLDLAIADFLGIYANVTEGATCTFLRALAVDVAATWTATNVATIVTSITNGISYVYNASKQMADTMWLSLDETMAIAGLVSTDYTTTAFSVIRQALTDAGIPNFKFITGPQFAADTRIIGASSKVESYEQQKGFLSAANVSHLGADIAYRGYVAFYGEATAFTQLT